MAVQTPLILGTPAGGQGSNNILPYNAEQLTDLHDFAPWVYAQNPSVRLEVNTANGTLISGQPFVDTYYIAGSYVTRVDRFATEAETPNISLSTDNYSRLRLVYDSVTLPTGDTNNTQYPLYLYNDGSEWNLRTMSNQDFRDTFVDPALASMETDGFWNGGTGAGNGGTYYLSTNSAPAGGTAVSLTPVAVNGVANLAAYTGSGIPEVQKQTTDTNYYVIKVDPASTDYPTYTAEFGYGLPLYFDPGDEQIKQHTPTTWANLLGPFLRYYLADSGSSYYYNYNLDDPTSTGVQVGSTYIDTRLNGTSTFATRFVNADDYRTQEFPAGTASTITANTQRLYIDRGTAPQYAASSTPSGSVVEGQTLTFTMTTQNVSDGTVIPYLITGITAADIFSGSLSGNVTIASGSASTSVVLVIDSTTEAETATCTFTTTSGNRAVSVDITDAGIDDIPSNIFTQAQWGTESVILTGQAPGQVAQAFCSVTLENDYLIDGTVSLQLISHDNQSASSAFTTTLNLTGYTSTPTIEFRWSATNEQRTGSGWLPSETSGGNTADGTWVTVATGTQKQFEFLSESITPSSGTVQGNITASDFFVEIRVSGGGSGTTVTKTSPLQSISLTTSMST